MSYKLTPSQITDGWVLFKDRFPELSELHRGKFINVMYGDGSVSTEQVNSARKSVQIPDVSQDVLIAWQTPKPLAYVTNEAYTAIPYGVDGLHAVKRNSDGFIRAWDIPGEHYARRIADEYNRAHRLLQSAKVPHERQV